VVVVVGRLLLPVLHRKSFVFYAITTAGGICASQIKLNYSSSVLIARKFICAIQSLFKSR